MATKNFAPVGGEQEYLFELDFPSVFSVLLGSEGLKRLKD